MPIRFLKPCARAETLLVALIVLIYARSLGNVFVDLDDQLLIVSNPIAWGLSWNNIVGAFTSYDPELYIPLTLLTYQIEYSLFGLNPMIYHITSLILHILSTLLVIRIFTTFFTRRTALLCALLFGLHPMNTEAVSWASGLKDVLSSFFFLLSTWSYLQWKESGKGYKISVGTFALGLAAKVSIMPLPFILVLIDWLQKRPINLKEKLPYFALALLFMIVAIFGKSQMSDVQTWLTLSLAGIPFYISKFIAPVHLSILYPFLEEVSLSNPTILWGLIHTIGLVIAMAITLKWTRHFAFAGMWFFLLIAPALPTVIKGGEDGAIYLYLASDRYMYLAGIGVLFLIGSIINNRRALQAVTLAIVMIFAVLTYRQSLVWRDSESLFTHVIEQEHPAYVAYLSLARVHAERGEFDEALKLYQTSYDIHPSSKALLNIGQILTIGGKHDEAITIYMRIIKKWPNLSSVYQEIGKLHMQMDNTKQALPFLLKAVELSPKLISAHFHIGIIYEDWGQNDEAIAAFKRVLELSRGDKQALRRLQKLGITD